MTMPAKRMISIPPAITLRVYPTTRKDYNKATLHPTLCASHTTKNTNVGTTFPLAKPIHVDTSSTAIPINVSSAKSQISDKEQRHD